MRFKNHFFQQKARVELLPLIDVVFLLLVFFIYVMLSMTLHRGIEIDLPGGSSSVIEKNVIVITITESGDFQLDEDSVELEFLVDELKQRLENKDMSVLIRGDKKSDLGVAVSLLDTLRRHNITRVSFAVEQDHSMP